MLYTHQFGAAKKAKKKAVILITALSLLVQPLYSLMSVRAAESIPEPDIHGIRYTVMSKATGASYDGINLDLYLRGFAGTKATGYRAIVHRTDGTDAVRVGSVDVLAIINGATPEKDNTALSTAFNVYGSAASSYFLEQKSIWTKDTKPTGVTIEVDLEDGRTITGKTDSGQPLVEGKALYSDILPDYSPFTDIHVNTLPNNIVGNVFTVSGTATADLGLNRVYVQLVNRQDNKRYGETTINLLPHGASKVWTVEYNANKMGLPDGNYAAHAQVVAKDSKRYDTDWTENFELDATMPEFEIISPADSSTVSGNQEIKVRIKDKNDITKVLMNVGDGKGNYTWEQGKNGKISRSEDDNEIFTLSIDTNTLQDGLNHIVLRATDGAGNTKYFNNRKDKHSYNVLNGEEPKALHIITDITEIDTLNSPPVIKGTASWSDETPAIEERIEVYIDGTLQGEAIVDEHGEWEFIVVNELSFGEHTAMARHTTSQESSYRDFEFNVSNRNTGSGGRPQDQSSGTSSSSSSVSSGGSQAQSATPFASFVPITVGDGIIGASVVPVDDSDDGEVLGASDSEDEYDSGNVLGAADDLSRLAASQSDRDGFKILGIDWYWPVLSLIAAFGLWWIIAGKRFKNAEERI